MFPVMFTQDTYEKFFSSSHKKCLMNLKLTIMQIKYDGNSDDDSIKMF